MRNLYSCYVINLDRSPERLAKISHDLKSLEQTFERVRAHDGMAYTTDQIAAFYNGSYSPYCGEYIKNTWVCITLSHVDALKSFLKSDFEFGVILEDDVRVGKQTFEVIDHLCHLHQERKTKFDMVELIGPNKTHQSDTLKLVSDFGPFKIGRVAKTVPLAACMLYTREGARKILHYALPVRTHWDNYLSHSWFHGAHALTVRPFPAWHDKGNESVPAQDTLKQPTPTDKFRRSLFKAYQGPMRFLYKLRWMGLGQFLNSKGTYIRSNREWRTPGEDLQQ